MIENIITGELLFFAMIFLIMLFYKMFIEPKPIYSSYMKVHK